MQENNGNKILLQVGVKALLKNNEGKYLLLKRNPDKYKNTKGNWDIPGGRIESESTLSENLKREIKEETGLELKGKAVLLAAQDIIPDPGMHIVRLTYLSTIEGTPHLNEEHLEFKWFTIKELEEEKDLDIYLKEILASGLMH